MKTTTKVFLGLSAIIAIAAMVCLPFHWGTAAALSLAVAGTTINESPRLTDLIMFQEGEEANYIVDVVTVASGTVASAQGQILGKITATGKYVQLNTGGADGSQIAAAVLIQPFTATLGADTQLMAITRGPVIFKAGGLAYTAAMTAPQKATALAQLQAAGMPTRTDYGA
jgi:hypothetical protein